MKNIRQTAQLLNEHLEISEDKLALSNEINDYELLKQKLKTVIDYLIQHNFERLLQAMYRIDVKEEDFEAALQAGDTEKIAELVIQREIQKIEWREKYKQ